LGSIIKNDARCTHDIKCRFCVTKSAVNRTKSLLTSRLDLSIRKKLMKFYIWSIAVYGAETWTIRKVDQKYLGNFRTWCWRRMDRISWTDGVRNEEILVRVKNERKILHK
jgi:hypothetical protein